MTENNRMHAPRTFYCHELDIWNGVMHGSAAKQAGAAAKLAKKQAQTAGRKLKDRKK